MSVEKVYDPVAAGADKWMKGEFAVRSIMPEHMLACLTVERTHSIDHDNPIDPKNPTKALDAELGHFAKVTKFELLKGAGCKQSAFTKI